MHAGVYEALLSDRALELVRRIRYMPPNNIHAGNHSFAFTLHAMVGVADVNGLGLFQDFPPLELRAAPPDLSFNLPPEVGTDAFASALSRR